MKCKYCGKNNRPGAIVCKRCGIALPTSDTVGSGKELIDVSEVTGTEGSSAKSSNLFGKKVSSGSKLKLTKKSALIGLCVLLGIMLLSALVIVIAVNAGNIILPSRNSYSVHSNAVFYNGESVVPNSSGIASAKSNLDGTRAAILTNDGTLFSCGKGLNSAAANSVKSFDVSVNGKKIIFTDKNSLLWSYDCTDASAAPISVSNEAVAESFVISPDGGSVLFVRKIDGMLCAFVNGNVRELEGGLTPISVSDGGKNIYCYSSEDNSVYFFNKRGKKSFVRSRVEKDIWLNSKHDEIILATDSGEGIVLTLLIKDGGEPVSILNAKEPVSPILPVTGLTIIDEDEHFTVRTCPFKSFSGKLFSGASLVSYNSKTGATTLDSDPIKLAVASDNYGTVFCLSLDGKLTSRNLARQGEAVSIASDCSDFTVSANGKTVWYIDSSSKLWYMSGSNVRAVAGNIDKFSVLPSGINAVFISNGSLYINKGGRSNRTYSVEASKVSDVFSDARGLYFMEDNAGWSKIEKVGKRIDLLKQSN